MMAWTKIWSPRACEYILKNVINFSSDDQIHVCVKNFKQEENCFKMPRNDKEVSYPFDLMSVYNQFDERD